MERFIEQALVLSTVDYGDADRLVTFLTSGRGKLTAFAAGARKSKRRFAGALEPFTLVRAQLVERRGNTLRLDGVDIEQGFYAIRESLPRIARALYCLELCRELVRDQEPQPELYASLLSYLKALEANQAGPTSLVAFELRALAHAGLMPRLDACARCGGAPTEGLRFDPDHGGIVCGACQSRVPGGVPVALGLVRALNGLQRGEREPMQPEARERARELLNLFIAHQLGRKLRSVDFMAQVGLD
ncbi:MAG TPA: DNA repair protein RecO [Myxococcaceae bacterium]|nr:DNA repair protein RecO [Myxococcaceae bacterium]